MSGKKVVFYSVRRTAGFYAVECELRPCSRAEKARIRAPQPLSSQHLIRNVGAGPGLAETHTLSVDTLTPLPLTRSPTKEARQRDVVIL